MGRAGLEKGSRDQGRQVLCTAPARPPPLPGTPSGGRDTATPSGPGTILALGTGQGAEGQSSLTLLRSKTGTEIQLNNHQEIKQGWGGAVRHMYPPPRPCPSLLGEGPRGRYGKSHRNGAKPTRSTASRGLTCSAAAPRHWPAAPG